MVVAPEYRLCPDVKQPTQAHDIRHTFLHFHEKAAVFGIDSTRMTLYGESGAGLATLSAARHMMLEGHADKIRVLFLHEVMVGQWALDTPDEELTTEEKKIHVKPQEMWAMSLHS